MTTAFLSDERFAEHDTGPGHPERAARLTNTLALLHQQDWFDRLRAVSTRSCETQWLRAIHNAALLERAKVACEEGRPYLDSPDVAVSPQSFEIARLAAGGVLSRVDEILGSGSYDGFGLVRPPGPH